jgi:hypothetical protein
VLAGVVVTELGRDGEPLEGVERERMALRPASC